MYIKNRKKERRRRRSKKVKWRKGKERGYNILYMLFGDIFLEKEWIEKWERREKDKYNDHGIKKKENYKFYWDVKRYL